MDFLGVQPHEKSKCQFLKMVDFSDFVMPRILLYKMFESWNLTQTFYSRSLTSGWILSKNWFNMKKYWPLQIWHFWLCRYYHMNFQSHNQFFKKSFPVPLGVFRVPKSVSSTEFTPEVKFQSIKVILTENRDLSQIYPKVRVANLWSQNYWRDAFLKNFQICSKTVKYVISTSKLA